MECRAAGQGRWRGRGPKLLTTTGARALLARGSAGRRPIEAAQITGHSPEVWARHYARSCGKAQRQEARRRMLEHGFGAAKDEAGNDPGANGDANGTSSNPLAEAHTPRSGNRVTKRFPSADSHRLASGTRSQAEGAGSTPVVRSREALAAKRLPGGRRSRPLKAPLQLSGGGEDPQAVGDDEPAVGRPRRPPSPVVGHREDV